MTRQSSSLFGFVLSGNAQEAHYCEHRLPCHSFKHQNECRSIIAENAFSQTLDEWQVSASSLRELGLQGSSMMSKTSRPRFPRSRITQIPGKRSHTTGGQGGNHMDRRGGQRGSSVYELVEKSNLETLDQTLDRIRTCSSDDQPTTCDPRKLRST